MSLVDAFFANESLEGFVLDEADYSEIAFGIIIGNLDKISSFSPNFLQNLRKSEETCKEIKIVLLGKVFDILSRKVNETNGKERNSENILIGDFTEATDILARFSDFGQLFTYIRPIFCSAFDLIVNKFLGNTNILKIIIDSYSLIETMGLKNNIFIYEPDDLEYILESTFENPNRNLDLIKTGFSVISDMNLTPKELLSIVAYRQFYEYLCFLIRNKDFFDFSAVQQLLDNNYKHFTFKQSSKIEDALRNIEINHSVKFQFNSKASDDRPRKNFEQKNYKDPSECDEWSFGYRGQCYEAELDYSQNEINLERDFYDNHRQGYKNSYDDKRSYRQNSYSRNRRYRSRNEYPREYETKDSIKNGLRDVVVGIRDKSRENIDISVLRDLLLPFVEKDQYVVYDYLYYLSYNEKRYSTQSIVLWTSICNALRQIHFFDRKNLDNLQYNLDYIKENRDY